MEGKIKKIAFVSDAVLPFNIGGKEKRLYEITTRLAKNGHEVTVYTMKWWKDESDTYIMDGVKYKAISKCYPLYNGSVRSIKQGILFSISCLRMLTEDFDFVDVDHMTHLNLYSMKLVCLLKNKKMYATWHEVWGLKYWMNYIGPVKGSIAFIIEKVSSFLPDKIIAISEYTENQLKNVLHTSREIVVIPAGVVVNLNKNMKVSKSDLIFAGRLLPNKNVDLIIKAVAQIKKYNNSIKVSIVGDGPERQNLEKLARDVGVESNVDFLGFLEDPSELHARMYESKVFVFPSSREGFGIAVVEANACGIPVVTVDSPDNGSKFLIKDGHNGLLVGLNEEGIKNGIVKSLENKKDKQYYQKYSEKYDWNNVISSLEIQYN